MKEYIKIKTLWGREDARPHNMIIGKFAEPEFEQLKDVEWTFTEKVDGTNVRVMWEPHQIKPRCTFAELGKDCPVVKEVRGELSKL